MNWVKRFDIVWSISKGKTLVVVIAQNVLGLETKYKYFSTTYYFFSIFYTKKAFCKYKKFKTGYEPIVKGLIKLILNLPQYYIGHKL